MDNVIEIKNLTKKYGDFTAVNDLNLTIKRGEVFGLLGPNGAGKTTTTLMLLGLTESTTGTAFVDGLDCMFQSLEIKKEVGYLPDNVGFYEEMTGFENLCYTGSLNGLNKKTCKERANKYLKRVSMEYAADQKVLEYSRGMRQRLGIADVLMKEPKIIIMDEPTLGIDPEGIRELIALIQELSSVDGRTILLSSHQLYQVQQICDRVGIFVEGKLIACGEIKELSKQLQNKNLYILDIGIEKVDQEIIGKISAMSQVLSVTKKEEEMIQIESTEDIRNEIAEMIIHNQYKLLYLKQKGGDLEEIYRKYFEKEEQDDKGSSSKKRVDKSKGFNLKKKA